MEQQPQHNNEKKENGIKEEYSHTSVFEDSTNMQIDALIKAKFSGVELDREDVDHHDPNYQALHDNHFDNFIHDEFEVKRTLQFKDENQQKEFHRLVGILKNGTTEEKKELLQEIGYYKDTE